MELILISDSKLKITLSPEDMRDYEIDCSKVDYKSTETRRAFWCILDEAKQRTGFDAARQRVYIQLYPSREGGCEMYVTKLDGTTAVLDKRPAQIEHTYIFDSMSDMLALCRRLVGFSGVSDAYRDENGRCLLFLRPFESVSPPRFISEYGRICEIELIRAYANEHCQTIRTGDAVQTLAELA